MKEYIAALQSIADDGAIQKIDAGSELDVDIVKQLYKRGFIDAVDASDMDGNCYLEPKISMAGKEWLESRLPENSSKSEDIIELKPNFMGVGVNLRAWWRRIWGKT